MPSFHPQPHDNRVTISTSLISYSSWSNSDTAKEINHGISAPKRDRNNVVCRASARVLYQYVRETSKIRIPLSILVRGKYSQLLTFNYFPNPNETPVSWNLKPMNTSCILFPNCVILSVYCVLCFLLKCYLSCCISFLAYMPHKYVASSTECISVAVNTGLEHVNSMNIMAVLYHHV